MPIVASFPISDTTVSFIFPFLYVKNSIGWVALSKDRLPFCKSFNVSAAIDGRKKCLGIELAEFLGRYGFHEGSPFRTVQMRKASFL
jgi:hypothetical protein